jgi:hypothetical protein
LTASRPAVLFHRALFIALIPLYLLASFLPRHWSANYRKRTAARLPRKIIITILELVDKVHHSEEAIPDYRTLTAASRICRSWRNPAQEVSEHGGLDRAGPRENHSPSRGGDIRALNPPSLQVIYLHVLLIGGRRGQLFLASDATKRLANKSRRAELVALSGEMIWSVCELLESLKELSLRGDLHRHVLDGVCSCAVFGLPSLKGEPSSPSSFSQVSLDGRSD